MPDPTPASASLIPPPRELRGRLAIALREVDLLRRLIRVAESVTRYDQSADPLPAVADRKGVCRA